MILLTSCIDPYLPPVIDQEAAVLVIDGFININEESTIRLSRSQNIYDTNTPLMEPGAIISIEDEAGTKVLLTETEPGSYVLPQQMFSANKYRLNVQTKNLKEYQSSFEQVKVSPPIDSLTWNLTDNLGVQIKVNTHDSKNEKGFYRWTFEETWLYTSAYESTYIYNYQTRSVSTRTNDIFHCYRKDKSTDILIESTARLSNNLVSDFPVKFIPPNSERLRYTYSILVKQYLLTENAFIYWQQLKKSTEDLGTLFGPLPSQVTGNFQCLTNPTEPIIGYFGIGTITSNRKFISFEELPTYTFYETPYKNCEIYELLNANVANFSGPFLLAGSIPNFTGPGILGYYYSDARCVDCRLTGGTTTKPDFWP